MLVDQLGRSERLMTARELSAILAMKPKTIYSSPNEKESHWEPDGPALGTRADDHHGDDPPHQIVAGCGGYSVHGARTAALRRRLESRDSSSGSGLPAPLVSPWYSHFKAGALVIALGYAAGQGGRPWPYRSLANGFVQGRAGDQLAMARP